MTPETYNEQIQKKLAQKGSAKIVYFAPDTDLRAGHDGLAKVARKSKQKIYVETLLPGEYLIFTNKAKNALKLYACGNVIAHLKLPPGQKLNMEAIQFIPCFFNGKKIDYDSALEEAMKKQFDRLDRKKGKTYNA